MKQVQKEFPEKITLIDRLDYLIDPDKRLQQLEKRLQQVKRFDAESWYDYSEMKYISAHHSVDNSYVIRTDCFVCWRDAVINRSLKQKTIATWKTTRDPIWLVPIVIHARNLGQLSPDIVRAIQAIPKSSLLWHSVNWYYARLLITEKRFEAADQIVNVGLEITPVNRTELRSVRNYWLQFKTITTPSQDEFWDSLLRFEPHSPRAFELITDPNAKTAYLKNLPSLDQPVTQPDFPARIYNNLPLGDLISAVQQRGATLPASVVIDISGTAMVRAFLMDDWEAAKTMVDPYLSAQSRIQQEIRKKYNPKHIDYQALRIKAALLKFKQANSLAENRLAAAIVVQSSYSFSLRLDVRYNHNEGYFGFRGNLADCDEDTLVQNNRLLSGELEWKCLSYNPDYIRIVLSEIAPRSFSQDQIEKSAAEAKVQARKGSPSRYVWLGEILIPAAKSQPNDPRLPEAFHKLIYQSDSWFFNNSTIYGLTRSYGPGHNYSKEAFQMAHKLWPKNEWVKRTKYWY
ncbi:MAG: hypothetical protein ORO03_06665 [Alphaproteobacteria bacterium]|nr:hypothetical protein [Alphaproteobacteria bacterium]